MRISQSVCTEHTSAIETFFSFYNTTNDYVCLCECTTLPFLRPSTVRLEFGEIINCQALGADFASQNAEVETSRIIR